MTMQIADAFVGLRVIEFAQGVAAPYCGLLLGRNGADVIKVEPPVKGDWCRGLGLRFYLGSCLDFHLGLSVRLHHCLGS